MKRAKIILSAKFISESAQAGDFNRDGTIDVVAGGRWFAGPDFKQSHEIFSSPDCFDPHGYSPTTQPCFVHDFNGDGWPDVFYVMRPAGPKGNYGFYGWGEAKGWEGVWYENPAGRDEPWKPHRVLDNISNECFVWGDVNGDGRPEAIYSSREGVGYAVFDPQAPGRPWTFRRISEPLPLKLEEGIGFGDIAGNGRMDILAPTGWWEQPARDDGATPWRWHPHAFAQKAASMFVYDVDGDGLNDVITIWHSHQYGLVWHRQVRGERGGIAWERREILPIEPDLQSPGLRISQMHALAMADMNGDGVMDIVTGKRYWAHGPTGDVEPDAPPVVYWFEIRRGGPNGAEFIPHRIDDDSGVGTQITVADLDGDGRPDIVTSNKKGTFAFINPMGACL